MRKLIVTVSLVVMLMTGAVCAQQTDPAQTPMPKPKPPAPKLTFADKIKQYLKQVGATVDPSKSTPEMILSNHTDANGDKIKVVITNAGKNLIGFYIYNFGSVKNVANREAVYKYLLLANNAITIGSFFVDDDEDIGYKYLVSSTPSFTVGAFGMIYLKMAAVARDRKPEIHRLLDQPSNSENKSAGNELQKHL